MVIDQKSVNLSIFDNKPTGVHVIDSKPRMKKVSDETQVYIDRIIAAGQWMGSPFLTYPNQLIIARP